MTDAELVELARSRWNHSGPGDRKQISASMRVSFGLLLEDGKKIVAAQAADPVTDRRVSVEVTATILK